MEKKKYKNIVAINGIYLTSKYYGSGFSSYLQTLIEELSKNKTKNQYYVFTPVNIISIKKSTNLIYIKLTPKYNHYLTDILKYIKEHNLPIQKVYLAHLETIPTKFPLRIYMTIHDIIPILSLNPFFIKKYKIPLKGFSLKGINHFLLLKKIQPKIEKIIAISETTKKDLTQFFPKLKNKLEIINPLINPEFRKYSQKKLLPILRKYNLQFEKYFIYFGGNTQRKNVTKILDFFVLNQEKFSEPLVVIGKNDIKKSILLKLAKNKNFIFLNKLLLRELSQLVSGAKFSIYASSYEGFGLPIVESLQSGTFPLISDIPTTKEITKNILPSFPINQFHDLEKIITNFSNQKKRQQVIKRIMQNLKLSNQKKSFRI